MFTFRCMTCASQDEVLAKYGNQTKVLASQSVLSKPFVWYCLFINDGVSREPSLAVFHDYRGIEGKNLDALLTFYVSVHRKQRNHNNIGQDFCQCSTWQHVLSLEQQVRCMHTWALSDGCFLTLYIPQRCEACCWLYRPSSSPGEVRRRERGWWGWGRRSGSFLKLTYSNTMHMVSSMGSSMLVELAHLTMVHNTDIPPEGRQHAPATMIACQHAEFAQRLSAYSTCYDRCTYK